MLNRRRAIFPFSLVLASFVVDIAYPLFETLSFLFLRIYFNFSLKRKLQRTFLAELEPQHIQQALLLILLKGCSLCWRYISLLFFDKRTTNLKFTFLSPFVKLYTFLLFLIESTYFEHFLAQTKMSKERFMQDSFVRSGTIIFSLKKFFGVRLDCVEKILFHKVKKWHDSSSTNEKPLDKCNLYVKGLGTKCTQVTLDDLFRTFGVIVQSRVYGDGIGFIRFENPEAAEEV
ncbi:hypothetical protein RFI_02227 [Reticulomyxa filosa]|uniref:RRM domain-containing protein n=1 Tax=Reticulomyxa filosa TaxID=46433 RepID=X6PB39_RETFI|nr:hypothetical protein RFI_02227 [Reticulomyxa filosa]|eukprot:ETO34857.1 hypothetical protein RFI_02227 [Reticulomyxa filosa]